MNKDFKVLFNQQVSQLDQLEHSAIESNANEASDRSLMSKITRQQYKMPVNQMMDEKVAKRQNEKAAFKEKFEKLKKLKMRKAGTLDDKDA